MGGPVGNGRQYVSWIVLSDLVGAIRHCVANEQVRGAVNGVAPESVMNRDFARALGRAVRRPACMPAPAFALKLAMGEMADELLFASARVRPEALIDAGFPFGYPELAPALQQLVAQK